MAALGLAISWAGALAQPQTIAPYEEYEKFTRAAQAVAPLTSELFGDQISLYNGSTEFVVTDIDLPGNNSLPVQLRRRFKVESKKSLENLGGFGVWDIDIPHITGNFYSAFKWNEGEVTSSRCLSGNWGPKLPGPPFDYGDVFTGIRIHLAGGNGGDLLKPRPGNPYLPADGASYPYVSQNFTGITCVAATKNGYPGEGFVAVTTDGLRYTFDVGVERHGGIIRKDLVTYSGTFSRTAGRTQVFLLVGRVEDRHGNWVSYDYAGDKLTTIRSSDGRRIDLHYEGNKIVEAVANGRYWTYAYTPIKFGLYLDNHLLNQVTQPDGSAWKYQYEDADGCTGVSPEGCPGLLGPEYHVLDVVTSTNPKCPEPFPGVDDFTLTATHPSGAEGEFRFALGRLHRTGTPSNTCIPRSIPNSVDFNYELQIPDYFDNYVIVSKKISGSGVAPQTWSYNVDGPVCRWGDNCPDRKTAIVNNPDGSRLEYVFGVKYGVNDGKLLESRMVSTNGAVVRSESMTYVSDTEAISMPFLDYFGSSYYGPDDPLALRIRPIKRTTITQDGETFSRAVNAFDEFARPTRITKFSSLNYGRYSRTEEIIYHDDHSKWVLGQIKQVTQVEPTPAAVISRVDYNAAGLPWRQYRFGLLQQTSTFNADGTLATVKDGKGNTTTISGWKRGVPETILYADGSQQSATVDDNGWIRSITDSTGSVTKYDYDQMGRLALVDYPDDDTVNWTSTVSKFVRSSVAEYGLEAGHWKQIVSTGNARKVTYFDVFWRPVVEENYDIASVSDSLSQTVKRYDPMGRLAFQSHPLRGVSDHKLGMPGTHIDHDVLGRRTRVEEDTELGKLVTRTDYLSGFKTRVTSPRGAVTTTSFLAYDQPITDWPVDIAHPEGVHTTFTRDAFGMPTRITRRNADGSTQLTRTYVYGTARRLCMTIEPESGTTVFGYDNADNLIHSASGLPTPTGSLVWPTSGETCSKVMAEAPGRRVKRDYDARNRLSSLTFPDGNGNQNWTYWPDGRVKQVVTANWADGNPVLVTNAYSYNKRRLLTSETLAQTGDETWRIGYAYDTNGHLASHTYPSGLNIAYGPNALGQPTRAGGYATDVRYLPNGAMAQFTYGNGLIHTLKQNARGLPERSRDASASVTALDDSYDYDAHGNVVAISDARPGNRGHRDMSYDGLDRLITAESPMFGVATYAYDVLDNLKQVKIGSRDNTYIYDSANQLTNIMAGSSTVIGLSYDVQGNLSNKNGNLFIFDYGNRLRAAGGETYRYDGHGRRIQATHAVNGDIYSLYGHDGVLRHQRDHRQATATDYVMLNKRLVAQISRVSAPAAPIINSPGYSTNGNYIVAWNAVPGTLSYAVEESAGGGAWIETYSGSANNQSVSGRVNGTYTYRVKACNAAGCGPWSALAVVFVQRAPNPSSGIVVPALGPNGAYTISWLPPRPRDAGLTEYTLEERFNDGGWSAEYIGTNLSKRFNGKAAGSYTYRVKACNPYGCSEVVTAVNAVEVLYPPAIPVLTVPTSNLTGSYTVSWSPTSGATSYRLDENFNSGNWNRVHDAPTLSTARSDRQTGTYGYRVAACNSAGCSVASASKSVAVITQPTSAPSVMVPANNNSGNFVVGWSTLATASRYELVERFNGGGFSLIYDGAAINATRSGRVSGSWEYQVRACNAAGCGPYSRSGSVQVLLPPTTAPSITNSFKAQTSHSPIRLTCSVAWTPIAHADRYELWSYGSGQLYQKQYDGPETSVGTTLNQNRAIYCAPQHVVRACNVTGCSPWSAPVPQALEIINTGGGGGDVAI